MEVALLWNKLLEFCTDFFCYPALSSCQDKKLKINDFVLSIDGKPMEIMSSSDVSRDISLWELSLHISYRKQIVDHFSCHYQSCIWMDIKTLNIIDVLTCTLLLVNRLDVLIDLSSCRLPSWSCIVLPFVPLADYLILFRWLTWLRIVRSTSLRCEVKLMLQSFFYLMYGLEVHLDMHYDEWVYSWMDIVHLGVELSKLPRIIG